MADRYRTLVEERPHRPAHSPDEASRAALGDVRRGALDPQAAAVLEVAALVAESLTNREIAARLVISRRTAEHHVQHVYAKLGVSSRAAVTLFAVEHGLVDATQDAPDHGSATSYE